MPLTDLRKAGGEEPKKRKRKSEAKGVENVPEVASKKTKGVESTPKTPGKTPKKAKQEAKTPKKETATETKTPKKEKKTPKAKTGGAEPEAKEAKVANGHATPKKRKRGPKKTPKEGSAKKQEPRPPRDPEEILKIKRARYKRKQQYRRERKRKEREELLKEPEKEFMKIWEENLQKLDVPESDRPLPPEVKVRTDGTDEFEFIKQEAGAKWEKRVKGLQEKGSPLLLIVSTAGMRCQQLKNNLVPNKLGETCKWIKLFGKKKLVEQNEELGKFVHHAGAGTAFRLHHLLSEGSLKVNSKTIVMIDYKRRNDKTLRLFDDIEFQKDTIKFLAECKKRGVNRVVLF